MSQEVRDQVAEACRCHWPQASAIRVWEWEAPPKTADFFGLTAFIVPLGTPPTIYRVEVRLRQAATGTTLEVPKKANTPTAVLHVLRDIGFFDFHEAP